MLDHRREVFLPAIGQTVQADPGFRLFAAQNPASDGGGRKGLPRSFLNRFTRVLLTPLRLTDLRHICQHRYGESVEGPLIDGAVALVEGLRLAAAGSSALGALVAFDGNMDWDWNLRDALRLCDLLRASVPLAGHFVASAELLFLCRLRTARDRAQSLS